MLQKAKSTGLEYLDEALKYVEKHNLYDEALDIWEFGDPVRKVKGFQQPSSLVHLSLNIACDGLIWRLSI